jgi:AraC-like DNA-binding protein
LYGEAGAGILAEIAAALRQAIERREAEGSAGGMAARVLARGEGWSVMDVVCTSGPGDRSFAEQHRDVSIAVVAAGSFQYRSEAGRALLAPGAVMLANAGEMFECGHTHGAGDRCISFSYTPECFEQLAGVPGFRVPALPPMRAMSAAIARACAGVVEQAEAAAWEELSVQMAVEAARLAEGIAGLADALPSAEARVTRVVRMIEAAPAARHSVTTLAKEARLSPYHFLRTFESITGLTPHQYVMRIRLRRAASLLLREERNVLDVALDCGFGDISNFNRSFRAEFGVSPRAFRRGAACPTADIEFRG